MRSPRFRGVDSGDGVCWVYGVTVLPVTVMGIARVKRVRKWRRCSGARLCWCDPPFEVGGPLRSYLTSPNTPLLCDA